jgi:hypothetical protein
VENPCPFCNNRQVLAGFNDLATLHPELVKEWHPTRNGRLTPREVFASSNRKVWWQCDKGHEWEAQLKTRSKQNTGCPVCSGRIILPGFNDLATLHPELVKEWHPTRNHNTPEEIGSNYRKKVWWLGKCGHEWEALVGNRSRKKNPSGCPVCRNQSISPGVNDLATTNPAVAAIWDYSKNSPLTPDQVGAGQKQLVWWVEPCGHEYQMTVTARVKAKNCQVCINRIVVPGVNDLTSQAPSLANEWHPSRNSPLQPEQVTVGHPKRVWWQCDKGHEWEASPNDRHHYNTKCPYCSNQRVLPGYNDLATLYPELAAEWHPTLNPVTPNLVTPGADVKVWWECDKGHEWEAVVYARTNLRQATGCPMCNRRKVSTGETDLETLFPEVASQWHPEKNNGLHPCQVTAYSNRKAWWKCSLGHEWEAVINGRSQGRGCPTCSKVASFSKEEKELVAYLQNAGLTVVENDRNILDGQEVDIYLPEHNLAIEYNGLYWHTEKFKGRTSHHDKWELCKQKGIQLIQIWEDDYKRNPELVKEMLAHKIGISTKPKTYARKLHLTTITNDEAKTFLDQNHIQGWVSSSVFFGLCDAEETLCSVMALKETKQDSKVYTLTRYATNRRVVGGFTKLLKHAEKTLTPRSITTFSDNAVSDGSLYRNHGFTEDKTLPPDYSYFNVKERIREHKFLYRLKRFREDSTLLYLEGKTETELAIINNLSRIWDAGKVRWVKTYP